MNLGQLIVSLLKPLVIRQIKSGLRDASRTGQANPARPIQHQPGDSQIVRRAREAGRLHGRKL